MNFAQILQILTLLLTVASGIVTMLYGYKAVNRDIDDKLTKMTASLHEALRNKLDVSVYSAKVKELHDKNNDLEKNQAGLIAEIKTLSELVSLLVKRDN